jgi:hypothetical protein
MKTNSTCNTCKYWERDDSNDHIHGCSYPNHRYGYHIDEATVPENSIVVENDEG